MECAILILPYRIPSRPIKCWAWQASSARRPDKWFGCKAQPDATNSNGPSMAPAGATPFAVRAELKRPFVVKSKVKEKTRKLSPCSPPAGCCYSATAITPPHELARRLGGGGRSGTPWTPARASSPTTRFASLPLGPRLTVPLGRLFAAGRSAGRGQEWENRGPRTSTPRGCDGSACGVVIAAELGSRFSCPIDRFYHDEGFGFSLAL